METREWALVFFTIAAQMSVWSFVVWASCTSSLRAKRLVEADRLSDRALLALVPSWCSVCWLRCSAPRTPLKAYRRSRIWRVLAELGNPFRGVVLQCSRGVSLLCSGAARHAAGASERRHFDSDRRLALALPCLKTTRSARSQQGHAGDAHLVLRHDPAARRSWRGGRRDRRDVHVLPSQESRLRRVQCGLMLGPYGSWAWRLSSAVGVTTVRPSALSELPRQRP